MRRSSIGYIYLFALLTTCYLIYRNQSANGKRRTNIDEIERSQISSDNHHALINHITPEASSNHPLPHESISQCDLSSHSDSSLVKATSYDLLKHPDVPKLNTVLKEYLKNNRSTAACQLSNAKLHPFRDQLRVTALVSFPRSGNTWFRTMLEKSTGYLTSSIYCDPKLLRGGFVAECDLSNLFLIKTHRRASNNVVKGKRLMYERYIFLVRNPFDSVLSAYHFSQSRFKHTVKLPQFNLANSTNNVSKLLPMTYVKKCVARVSNLFRTWEEAKLPHMIVRYEDLKQSPAIVLRYARRFLVPAIKMSDNNRSTNATPHFL